MCLVNYLLQWWVEFDDELSWLFTMRLSPTRCMKVKRMGITEILRRFWLFSANEIKSSESFSKQPTQIIIAANNWLTQVFFYHFMQKSGKFFLWFFGRIEDNTICFQNFLSFSFAHIRFFSEKHIEVWCNE